MKRAHAFACMLCDLQVTYTETMVVCNIQVDSCSALVEDADGNLEILHWMDHYKEPAKSSPARSAERDVGDDVSDTESAVSQQAALLFDVLSLGNSPKRGSLLPREKQESPK